MKTNLQIIFGIILTILFLIDHLIILVLSNIVREQCIDEVKRLERLLEKSEKSKKY